MSQTITEHNINAEHFFRWMEKHWKYYVGYVFVHGRRD